ncbi:MAG TPA: erythromycin biosynthesis sensory transduction protein eryC1 [Verrucomicrobia bacterium]|nr:MAG: erythromycin biosynthesis sensory transduction protein eryC1 [Lentisphaerae bacterium GWF2_57_35]HBA84663.1 erythromycin biosynthesis sensory transduction protein eryC1 [Verrucomicrobiota bacterium]
MSIPFLDLSAQYRSLKSEIDQAIQAVIEQTAFAGGPFVAEFEEAFAKYTQCRYAAAASNGTEALRLALAAMDVGPGDEIVTVPNTFIATAEAISQCGATPIFVDVDARTHTMKPALIESAITPRTRGIIPVHLYGQMADMDPILSTAEAHGLFVLEDACQAHGAEYKGRKAGSLGRAGAFSFYPGKNLGAYGEGGAVTSNDEKLIERIKLLRDHGSTVKYVHKAVGCNGRMDGIQGAILSAKLPHLDSWNAARRAHAAAYRQLLEDDPDVVLPEEAAYGKHIYHIYPIRVPRRDQTLRNLSAMGIHCGIHYPIPVHLQEAYRFLGGKKGDFPAAEQSAEEVLSLPMYPELNDEQIEQVAQGIQKAIRN